MARILGKLKKELVPAHDMLPVEVGLYKMRADEFKRWLKSDPESRDVKSLRGCTC